MGGRRDRHVLLDELDPGYVPKQETDHELWNSLLELVGKNA